MPSNDKTLLRQWRMLREIRKYPKKSATKELHQVLLDEGYDVTLRTVQRDLNLLSEEFGLIPDFANPQGWSINKDFEFSKIAPFEAVSLLLVEAQLNSLMPGAIASGLSSKFESARKSLKGLSGVDRELFADKITAVPPMLSFVRPEVAEDVLQAVQQGILQSELLECTYQALGKEPKALRIKPLGLVGMGVVTYLVCYINDHTDKRQLPLHRFLSARLLGESFKDGDSFNVHRYIEEGGMQFAAEGSITLEARISNILRNQLMDVPLSEGQSIGDKPDPQGYYSLRVGLIKSWRLKWWILQNAGSIEVLAPQALREEIVSELKAGLSLYR